MWAVTATNHLLSALEGRRSHRQPHGQMYQQQRRRSRSALCRHGPDGERLVSAHLCLRLESQTTQQTSGGRTGQDAESVDQSAQRLDAPDGYQSRSGKTVLRFNRNMKTKQRADDWYRVQAKRQSQRRSAGNQVAEASG